MRRLELVSVTGELIALDAAPFYAAPDVVLSGMPKVAVVSHATLGTGGRRVGSRRHETRDVPLRLMILADSADEFDAAVGRLAKAVDPVVGDVAVRFVREDGTAREVVATYVDGFTNVGLRWAGALETEAPLIFEAFEPYWRSTTEVEYEVDASAFISTGESTGFDAPIAFDAAIPFNGFTDTGFQLFAIHLQGDVEAWPRWEVTGPAVQLTATNVTTGKLWTASAAVGTDEPFVMDTRPTVRSVTLDDANVFSTLSDDSELWPLVPGVNHIGLRVQGWDTAHSTIRMSWRERYLTC